MSEKISRITAGINFRSTKRKLFVTEDMIKVVNKSPNIILQHILYNICPDKNNLIIYQNNNDSICQIKTFQTTIDEEPTEYIVVEPPDRKSHPNGIFKSITMENILDDFIEPLFPFDLNSTTQIIEKEPDVLKDQKFNGIKINSNPFDIYKALYLMNKSNPGILNSVESILEIGSGLSTVSYILSGLCPNLKSISAVEINPNLTIKAEKIKRYLKQQYKYNFPAKVSNIAGDIFADNFLANFGKFDAVAIYPPIAHKLEAAAYYSVFKKVLNNNGLVLQLYTSELFCDIGSFDYFRPIDTDSFYPISIYQKK